MSASLSVRLWVLFQLLSVFSLSAATRTLTLSTNGNGSITANPTGNTYPHNSTVTLTAMPSNGWQFTGWSGDISGALNPTNVLMDADKTITGNFSQISSYTLIVNISGGGSVNPAGGTYLSNNIVSLTATASNGWAFHHWSGDASGSANPVSLTMNANKVVDAVFIQPVSISAQPQNVSAPPGGTATFNVMATGTAPLSYVWRFNGSPVPGANSATLTITNVQPVNGGNYDVIVSNPYSAATSSVALLTVSCPGTNVVTVASDAAFRAAVAIGGHVRLCFNGTVTLTNTIDVLKNTTIDGSGLSVVISGNNAVRLFNVNTGASLVLSNLVMANGRHVGTNGADAPAPMAARNGEAAMGGAIYNAGGFVRLVSCVFSNNHVQGGRGGAGNSGSRTNGIGGDALGGCAYNVGGTLILQNTIAVSNGGLGGETGNYSDGFTINGRGGSASGAVIYNVNGSVSVSSSFFSNNIALSARGGVVNFGRPVGSGGCVFHAGGSLDVSNSTFILNRALGAAGTGLGQTPYSTGGDARGGALAVTGGVANIYLCTFRSNSALGGNTSRYSGYGEALGGALYNRGNVTIIASEFSANLAQPGTGGAILAGTPLSGWGGAICNDGAAILSRCALTDNLVRGSDGGCFATPTGWPGGPAYGGAICNFSSGLFFATNCTIGANNVIGGAPCSPWSGEFAGGAYGGGIFNSNGSVSLVNVSIASNTVTVPAGSSYQGSTVMGANIANAGGTFALRNSLVAIPGTNSNVWGTLSDGGYNMSSDGSANFSGGTSFNFTDPKLLPLANYGGPTFTMALAADSPAIDWAPVAGAPVTDQRGFTRPFGTGVDIGAFELGPAAPSLTARRDGANIEVSFFAQAMVTYELQRSPDLQTWGQQELIGPMANDGVVTRTLPANEPQQFFRVTIR